MKQSDESAIASFDGGIAKVRLADLPEPLRAAWFDEKAVNERKERERNEKEEKVSAVRSEVIQNAEREKQVKEQISEKYGLGAHSAVESKPVESGTSLGGIAFLIFAIMIYFLPAELAASNKHRNALAVFLLNLFLGWTFIGWVVALVWASMRTDSSISSERR